MKKIIVALLALAGLTASLNSYAEMIPIDEAHFPDEVFRNYVLTKLKYQDLDDTWQFVGADGKLSEYERRHVASITFTYGVRNAEGIQYFAINQMGRNGLKIYVSSEELTSLDLSGMQVISVHAAGKVHLKTLLLTGCTKLKEVDCYESGLTSLDLTGCTALQKLNCKDCNLTSLTLTGCTALKTLECEGNQLTVLNVSDFTALKTLACQSNQLTALNIRGCTALQNLNCSENHLTELYLADCTNLSEVECQNNQIGTLNLTATHLESLDCSDNPLTALFLPDVEYLSTSLMHPLDLSCKNTQLTTLDLLDNEYRFINCSHSPINSIVWSQAGNGRVYSLDCSDTEITVEDINNIPNPGETEHLICDNCNLTTINVARFPNLDLLNCAYNKLTTIDVSSNAALKSCLASFNRLYAIDVTGTDCHNLGNCWQQFEQSAVKMDGKTYVELSDEVRKDSIYDLKVFYSDHPLVGVDVTNPRMQGRFLLVDDAGADVRKVLYYYHAGNGCRICVEIDTEGSASGIPINEYTFPDRKLRKYLIEETTYGEDALLTQEEIDGITDLDVQGKDIRSLEGIQYLTSLTYLNCSGNSLTDEGFNTVVPYMRNLRELWASDNPDITSFDAGLLKDLRQLYIYGCGLTFLNVGGCDELWLLDCSSNQLETLMVSDNLKLKNLMCSDNRINKLLGITYLTDLRSLSCDRNNLDTLNVSQCPMLANLICGGNNLTKLDLSNNANLKTLYVDSNRLTTLDLSNKDMLWSVRIFCNQIKAAEMRQIVTDLNDLVLDNNREKVIRIYHDTSDAEGNQVSPALIRVLRDKNWVPKHYDGSAWVDYEGGIVNYDLWIAGTQVTSENASDVLGDRKVVFDELTDQLTLKGAQVSNAAIALLNKIEGLEITVDGNSTLTSTELSGMQLNAKTIINSTNGSSLTVMGATNGIYIYADTLFVKGGATVSGASTGSAGLTTGFGIYGRWIERTGVSGTVFTYYGTLAIEGSGTTVKGLGKTASVGMLKALKMPLNTTIQVTPSSGLVQRPVKGYFYDHSVCLRSGSELSYTYTPATDQVTISAPIIPVYQQGDVNMDGQVTIADVTALVNIILGKDDAPDNGVADVNEDGSITIADVTALVNIILGK